MIDAFDMAEYVGLALDRMVLDWEAGWFLPRSEADVQGYLYAQLIDRIRSAGVERCEIWLEYPCPGKPSERIDLVACPPGRSKLGTDEPAVLQPSLAVEIKLLKSRSEQYEDWAERCHNDLRRLAHLNRQGWNRCYLLLWDILGDSVIRDHFVLGNLMHWVDAERKTDGKKSSYCFYQVRYSDMESRSWRGRAFLSDDVG